MSELDLRQSSRAAGRPSPERLMRLASAFYGSCVLFSASDAGIFDVLDELGSADGATVASRCGLNERAATLLLNACVAVDLLDTEDGFYRNRPDVSAFLVSGKPGDMSQAIRYNRDVYPAWGRLRELVRTGKPVEAPSLHLGGDTARTREFVLAMHGRAMAIGRGVIPALDLSECKRLLDVGGGSGAYSILAAQANPHLHATVLDLPEVGRIAAELIRDAGLSERVEIMPGDYRQTPFPQGNDAVLFFGVLHQESAASIRALLPQAYAALQAGGRVYVLDMMTDQTRCRPPFSALFAVNMALTAEHGWVFSDQDIMGWLDEAGFVDCQCRPCPPPMPHWLAQARKP